MKAKIHRKSCCPECGGEIEFDAGTIGSYFDPPQDPFIACTECEWSPESMDDIDWSNSPKPTPEQQARIDALRIEISDAYRNACENKRIPTIEDLFSLTPEGDFHWESAPDDVGNAYPDDTDWCVSFEYTDMGRKDGKCWYIVYEGDRDGPYNPVAGWDEREGDEPTAEVLADLWHHCEGRLLYHFAGWAKYDLDCAETGEDPLNNWYRPFTTEQAIAAAEDNLKYLRM